MMQYIKLLGLLLLFQIHQAKTQSVPSYKKYKDYESFKLKSIKALIAIHSNCWDRKKKQLWFIKVAEQNKGKYQQSIDFEGVKVYTNLLRKTNLFSNVFYDSLLAHFKSVDESFKICDYRYYLIPFDLDDDLIYNFLSSVSMAEAKKNSIIYIKEKTSKQAIVEFRIHDFYAYTFVFSNNSGKWQIDKISENFRNVL